MNKITLRSALSKIWALVNLSSQAALTTDQENELSAAIDSLESEWDEAEIFARKAAYVAMCARMLLAALTARPPRKPSARKMLIEDCQLLLRHLGSN